MNVKYIILCRYNSSRLPGKILKRIDGKPLLEILLERLLFLGKENLVIATSNESSDDAIETYCTERGYAVYRGSLQNVSTRFLNCAIAHKAEYAVRINGDNLFADATLIKNVVDIAVRKKMQFVSNVPNRTYPAGMSVEVIKVDFYKQMVPLFTKNEHKEHVTLYLYQHLESIPQYKFVENNELDVKNMHLAIDTYTDFKSAIAIIKELGHRYKEASWKEIAKLKKKHERLER